VLAVAVVASSLFYLVAISAARGGRRRQPGAAIAGATHPIGDLQQPGRCRIGPPRYLLTGDERYLEPLQYAGERVNQTADELVASYQGEEQDVVESARRLRYVAGEKIGELNASVALYRAQGPAAALALTQTDSGEKVMERFRNLARAMRDYEAVRRPRAGSMAYRAQFRGLDNLGARCSTSRSSRSHGLCATSAGAEQARSSASARPRAGRSKARGIDRSLRLKRV
jgi:hypothetical protein